MSRRFPLRNAPLCPSCDGPAQRGVTGNSGNSGRPYYFCKSGHKRTFVTWDDNEGISYNNVQCDCGQPSRLNTGKGSDASSWYNCSSKSCSFNEAVSVNDGVVALRSPAPVIQSSYQGSSSTSQKAFRDTSTVTVMVGDTADLHKQMSSMTLKIDELQQSLASARAAPSTPPANPNCPLHGFGRRSIFRRTRCHCH